MWNHTEAIPQSLYNCLEQRHGEPIPSSETPLFLLELQTDVSS